MKAIAAALVALAPLAAQAAEGDPPAGRYTIAPLPPVDGRNSYVPPQSAVYVIDNARGEVVMCFPNARDGKHVVDCTAPTKLFPGP